MPVIAVVSTISRLGLRALRGIIIGDVVEVGDGGGVTVR
jgi:hypothetical protein